MKQLTIILLVLVFLVCHSVCGQTVKFYSDTIFTFKGDFSNLLYKGKVKEAKLEKYFEKVGQENSYLHLSKKVKEVAEDYPLNGYFEALLFSNALKQINSKISDKQIHLLTFKYLLDQKYAVQLAKTKDGVVVFVASDEVIYDLHKIKLGRKQYYDIFDNLGKGLTLNSLLPFKGGNRKVTFRLSTVPKFKQPKFETKTLEYRLDYRYYSFDINFNRTLIDFLDDVPSLQKQKYFNFDLSPTVLESIHAHLEEKLLLLETDSSKVRFFLSFVRTLTEYKTDEDAYGEEKPMFAEEALYYQYTDCEDRSALFSWLIENYLKTTSYIVLIYPNHINIAISLKGNYSQKIMHKGKEFVICEPTIGDSVGIGESRVFNAKKPPKVIYYYTPPPIRE